MSELQETQGSPNEPLRGCGTIQYSSQRCVWSRPIPGKPGFVSHDSTGLIRSRKVRTPEPLKHSHAEEISSSAVKRGGQAQDNSRH